MADKYMNGWKNLNEVTIPPVRKKGFQENVIIRKKVEAVTLQRPKVMPEQATEKYEEPEELTVLMHQPDEGETVLLKPEDEERTVMLQQKITAYIKRCNTGEEVEITKDNFIVGKGSNADYIVRYNTTISRQHIVIRRTKDGYFMEDMKSSNHTYVNGEMISQPVRLVNGTQFKLSNEMFEFIVKIK